MYTHVYIGSRGDKSRKRSRNKMRNIRTPKSNRSITYWCRCIASLENMQKSQGKGWETSIHLRTYVHKGQWISELIGKVMVHFKLHTAIIRYSLSLRQVLHAYVYTLIGMWLGTEYSRVLPRKKLWKSGWVLLEEESVTTSTILITTSKNYRCTYTEGLGGRYAERV